MFIIEGVVCACLVHVLSCAQLCCQMERMQGEGETDHLEQPSPLTDKERVMIRDSWAKVYQSCDDAGVAILVRYLFLFTFIICVWKISVQLVQRVRTHSVRF